jgi:hypothetical protein
VPAKLRMLVDQLLAKKPDERIQTAGEVRRILDDVRESVPVIGERATPMAVLIPDTPDTIPDISPALAETHAAPPSGTVGRIVAMTPETPAPTAGGAKPRRYAIVAFVAVIPIAAAMFVVFNAKQDRSASSKPEVQHVGAPLDNVPLDAAPIDAGVEPLDAYETPEAVPAAAPIDAGVKTKKRDRKRPRVRSDAGAQDTPDIDFIP